MMRAKNAAIRLLMIFLVALALSACSFQGWDTNYVPTETPTGLDPLTPYWPVGVPTSSPTAGVALGDVRGYWSMPWMITSISPDRRSITVNYVIGSGCFDHAGYHVSIDGSAITLGEYSREIPGGNVCPALMKTGVETVALPVALDGSVQLFHAPTAESAPW